MNTTKIKLFFGLIATLLMGVVACAPAPERKKIDLVWPLPPDEPKIKFVDMISSTLDLGKKTGLAETLFGEERIEAFNKPYGVAVDKEGKIYVTDIGRVWVLDLENRTYDFIGAEAGTGQLRVPIGAATASDGRVFVTDTAADRVYVYVKGRYAAALGQTGEFESPSGVALDEVRGLVYVADAKKHIVNVYRLNDYSKIRTIGKRGTETAEFNFPTNIAVDAEGNVYVVDTGNFRVQIFDHEGKYLKTIGKLGDTPGSLARPKGIAIDSEGHIYVIDAAFQNYQIFDKDGNLLLFVGGAGVEPGQFLLPAGIAIDKEDKIYVVNQIPANLQIFQYLGEKWRRSQAELGREKNPGGSEKKGK